MQRKSNLIDLLCSDPVKRFLTDHEGEDPEALALRYSGKTGFELRPVLEFLEVKKKGRQKLPTHLARGALFTLRAYEQSSSEICAQYKASRVEGASLLNLCGGIGIDDWAFSSRADRIESVEIDEQLHHLAEFNLERMGCRNVHRIHTSAEARLNADDRVYDWIYADPDRRSASGRLVALNDLSPDLPALWPLIQERSRKQLLKLSPMYPLEQLEQELPGLKEISVVAVGNEVKEILAFYESGYRKEITRQAVVLYDTGSPARLGVRVPPMSPLGFYVPAAEDLYFMEANAAVAKASLGVNLAVICDWHCVVPNGIYACASRLPEKDIGLARVFRIRQVMPYSTRKLKAYFKELAIRKANFSARYFPHRPAELKKHLGIGDGGEDYFFFFQTNKNQGYVIHGTKLY